MIDVEALLQATDLQSLVGESVKLRRIAGGRFVGRCVFHNEKTGSLWVYTGKDAHYHCFGCGEHGNAIDWLTKAQGMSFKDACADLAKLAGIDATQAVDAPRPVLQPKDPLYPQPHWRPTLSFGGLHLMRGDLPVIVLHDFPGRRLYLEIADLMDAWDVIWFPRLPNGLTAGADQMHIAPIALQSVAIAPTSDPADARRGRDLERLIVRWRGYRIMARTRRAEWIDRAAPIVRADLASAAPAARQDAPETAIRHDAAA